MLEVVIETVKLIFSDVGKESIPTSHSKIVVSTVSRRLSGIRLAAALLGIVVIVAGISWGIVQHYRTATQNAAKHPPSTTQSLGSVEDDLHKQNFSAAQQTLKKASDAGSKSNLMLLATTYMGQRNYKQATQTYQEIAKQYGIDASLAINIAQAEQFSGNKQAALMYYQQAATLLSKQTDANSQQSLVGVEALIKQLQS